MSKELKTGTTTVGLVCKGGIVLGADMRATAGNLIVTKMARKLHKISDNIAVTWAGSVSDLQLISKLLKAQLKLKSIQTKRTMTVKEAANLLSGIVYQGIRGLSMIPSVTHFLLAGKDHEGFHLYDIFPDGSITECEKYDTSGSGSVFVYGVLETQYKEDMTLDEGVELASRAIKASLERDSASGGGITLAKISEKGVEELPVKKVVKNFE